MANYTPRMKSLVAYLSGSIDSTAERLRANGFRIDVISTLVAVNGMTNKKETHLTKIEASNLLGLVDKLKSPHFNESTHRVDIVFDDTSGDTHTATLSNIPSDEELQSFSLNIDDFRTIFTAAGGTTLIDFDVELTARSNKYPDGYNAVWYQGYALPVEWFSIDLKSEP